MAIFAKYQPIGRFDASTSAQHDAQVKQLLAGEADSLELDFSKVEFLSSAGLRVLLFAASTAEKKGGSLQVTGASPEIREIIVSVGFDDIVQLKD